MIDEERTGTEIDLGGEQEDPLDLPPGVEYGELPGDNPSEMDPEERDASPDEEEYPAGEAALEEEAIAEADGASEEQGADLEIGVPESDVETTPEAEAATSPPPKKTKSKKGKKGETGIRGYVILRPSSGEVGKWEEVFERSNPDEPFKIMQRSATLALRTAYRLLTEDEAEPQEYELLPIPEGLWKPKKVQGRVHKQTAISVG